MSDDLVTRLRKLSPTLDMLECEDVLQAADLIEELKAKLEEAMAYHAENARILGHVVDEAQGQIAAGKLAALEKCRERSATIKEKNDE